MPRDAAQKMRVLIIQNEILFAERHSLDYSCGKLNSAHWKHYVGLDKIVNACQFRASLVIPCNLPHNRPPYNLVDYYGGSPEVA